MGRLEVTGPRRYRTAGTDPPLGTGGGVPTSRPRSRREGGGSCRVTYIESSKVSEPVPLPCLPRPLVLGHETPKLRFYALYISPFTKRLRVPLRPFRLLRSREP